MGISFPAPDFMRGIFERTRAAVPCNGRCILRSQCARYNPKATESKWQPVGGGVGCANMIKKDGEVKQ